MPTVACLPRVNHRIVLGTAPVGVDVFDGAEIELAFVGGVLGDVGQPDLVGASCAEEAVYKVVVDRWTGSAVQSSLLAKIDQIRSWEPSRATRFSPAVIPRLGSSSAMNR